MTRAALIQILDDWKYGKTPISVVLEAIDAYKKKGRSIDQNNYYFGVIVNAAIQGIEEQWGEHKSKEEAHEILKRECNYEEHVNPETGEFIRIGKPTSDLGTMEFEAYEERCRKFIFEWFGIVVPLPNEVLK